MITQIKVRGFKSLEDFELSNIGPFICLIGLNGSGKTTFLQLLDFTSRLASGKVTEWFAERGWKPSEILNNNSSRRTFNVTLSLLIQDIPITWSFTYNVDRQRCTTENLSAAYEPLHRKYPELGAPGSTSSKVNLMSSVSGIFSVPTSLNMQQQQLADIKMEGSVFSAFNLQHPLYQAIIQFILSLKSLELLNPTTLRKASRECDEIGLQGDGLAGYINKMSSADRASLQNDLSEYYPDTTSFGIKGVQSGWKKIFFTEHDKEIPATQINDGLLRILTILSQRYSKKEFLLFDEIENGINQELIEKLLHTLQNFNGKQVLVTTHSALVLNYLSDQAAKDSVILLYKNNNGYTSAKKFFEIPEMAKQLEFIGPGQVMSQTNLLELAEQLISKQNNSQEK